MTRLFKRNEISSACGGANQCGSILENLFKPDPDSVNVLERKTGRLAILGIDSPPGKHNDPLSHSVCVDYISFSSNRLNES